MRLFMLLLFLHYVIEFRTMEINYQAHFARTLYTYNGGRKEYIIEPNITGLNVHFLILYIPAVAVRVTWSLSVEC